MSYVSLKIKKRTQTGWLLWMTIILPFLFGFLSEMLGLPDMLRYSLDVVWVLLFVYMVMARRRGNRTGTRDVAMLVFVFLVYTALVSAAQFQSVFYYLWGVRCLFRLFVAFFAFSMFLKAEDITYYFKVLDVLFWVNAVFSLVQFFLLGLNGDHLGGLFSTEAGGNGYTIVFLAIVITKDVLFYLERREKLGVLISKVVTALLIATLAELKFFFALALMIIALAALFTNFTWRKFWVIFGGLAAAALFAAVLVSIFGFEGFFSWDFFLNTATSNRGYTGAGDINRLNAIPVINELWLKNGWQQIFGLGLGNCDTAGFAFLNTPFYENYGHMHYNWISYAILYLETGWIGLIFYYGFFALVFIETWKIEKRSEGITKTYCRMGRILALCCMVLAIYNSSLRMEAGYMIYFALAVPFALNREAKTKVQQVRLKENYG